MTLVVEESVYAVKALNRNDLELKSKKKLKRITFQLPFLYGFKKQIRVDLLIGWYQRRDWLSLKLNTVTRFCVIFVESSDLP